MSLVAVCVSSAPSAAWRAMDGIGNTVDPPLTSLFSSSRIVFPIASNAPVQSLAGQLARWRDASSHRSREGQLLAAGAWLVQELDLHSPSSSSPNLSGTHSCERSSRRSSTAKGPLMLKVSRSLWEKGSVLGSASLRSAVGVHDTFDEQWHRTNCVVRLYFRHAHDWSLRS